MLFKRLEMKVDYYSFKPKLSEMKTFKLIADVEYCQKVQIANTMVHERATCAQTKKNEK